MTHAEQLAEKRYPIGDFAPGIDAGKRKAFVSGWEASEAEIIGFAEWISDNYSRVGDIFWNTGLDSKYLTTAQLLELYREGIKNKSLNTK